MKRNLLLLTIVALFTGCAAMNDYDRTYTLGYEDQDGHRLNTGVTLHPRTKVARKPYKPRKTASSVLREIFIDPYPVGDAYAGCSRYVPVYFP